jgi:hypothetical protein
MNALIVVFFIFIATIAIIFMNGHRVLKIRKHINKLAQDERDEIQEVSYVSYHGGLFSLPKPQKLTLALSDDTLFFVTNDGFSVRFPMQTWLKLEKVDTSSKDDMKGRKKVFGGSVNQTIFKDQIRFFISINFWDKYSGNADNHVLIEHGNQDQRDGIFSKINTAWQNYRGSIEEA